MKSIITSTGFGLVGGLLGVAIWSLFCSSVCMDSKDQSAESSSIGNNHLREPAFGESLLSAVRDNQQGVKNLSYRIAFIEKKLHELAASMNADQTWYNEPETTPVTGEASDHPEEPPRKELVADETPEQKRERTRKRAAGYLKKLNDSEDRHFRRRRDDSLDVFRRMNLDDDQLSRLEAVQDRFLSKKTEIVKTALDSFLNDDTYSSANSKQEIVRLEESTRVELEDIFGSEVPDRIIFILGRPVHYPGYLAGE